MERAGRFDVIAEVYRRYCDCRKVDSRRRLGSIDEALATYHPQIDANRLSACCAYIQLMVCVMEDDLIDDSGFELGMPTPVEMLRHQCTLLCAELETTRLDLRKAHKNIDRLIVM